MVEGTSGKAESKAPCGGDPLFFHGIPLVHLIKQAPLLIPDTQSKRRSPSRRADAEHLIRLLGFEPVHLLRSSAAYPRSRCIRECFCYGDTVWGFWELDYPRVQLSPHEFGVPRLDLRKAAVVFTVRRDSLPRLRSRFPHLAVWVWDDRIGDNRFLSRPERATCSRHRM